MGSLKNKKILLGVGGGIAAYKACELLRRLTDQGADVTVVLTESAQKFVTALTFQSLSQHPVHTHLFNLTEESQMSHITLADQADLVVIAPTTANLLARLAHGMADDLLTTTVLVTQAPVLLAPSMNVNMWQKPIVQENLKKLRQQHFNIAEPEAGYLACGWQGVGRLAPVETLIEQIAGLLAPKKKSLAGKNVLINAGPTREALDPVRFLTNPSSGKMGFALAQEAQRRGAKVTLVAGPVHLETPEGVNRIDVITAQEMLDACGQYFPPCDIFIATAAVGDYRPKQTASQKIKKSGKDLQLTLTSNPDILKTLSAQKKNGQIVVGFAAETEQLIENARKKLESKRLDMMIVNDVSQKGLGFAADQNQVLVLQKAEEPKAFGPLAKTQLAVSLLDFLEVSFFKK